MEEFRQNLKILEKKPAQMVNLRWQAVGILIALLSVFWAAIISNIFNKNKDLGVIYLSIFTGILFSILILFVWRWINHLMYEEEFGYKKNAFITRELLRDPQLDCYSSEKIRKEEDLIRQGDMKITFFEECLKAEFGNSREILNLYYTHKGNLNNKKIIELRKKLYNKWFEKGQWIFDWITFVLIIFLWNFGWVFLSLISRETSSYNIFNLFQVFIQEIIFLFSLILYPIFMYEITYLFPNFICPGTRNRCKIVEDFIKLKKKEEIEQSLTKISEKFKMEQLDEA